MTDTAHLVSSVKGHEGFRAEPYVCPAGRWTVGYGHNLEVNGLTGEQCHFLLRQGWLHLTITREGAEYLMGAQLARLERQCETHFDFWHALNDARQNVLVEMAFQLGFDGLRGFRRMLAALRRHDYAGAAREGLDSKWAREDSPARARRLMRQMEMGVFE
jgi:lysozyme